MTHQDTTDKQFTISGKFRIIALGLILIGIVAMLIGFFTHPDRAWVNLLLNNYYFLSLAIGAAFFFSLQYITQSGWSSMFKRIPEAMMMYLPVAGIIAVALLFGLPKIYHWAHPGAAEHDALLAHKAPYLNITFFSIRVVVFFALWILLSQVLRRFSLKEDVEGGMEYFKKSEFWSKVFIFVLAITFTLASFDYIMSIDAHWYSTIFSLKNFVAAFYHGAVIITLIVILLSERGYFPQLNESHLLDFSRYIFMLSIVWGYLYFSQFMLIWYGNIPEETSYFAFRWNDPTFKILFFANIVLNWFLPFIILLSRKADRSKFMLKIVCVILILGQYVDLYDQIIPGTIGEPVFGFTEIGMWLGFAGLFALVVARSLSKAAIIPGKHPYLDESLYHHVH